MTAVVSTMRALLKRCEDETRRSLLKVLQEDILPPEGLRADSVARLLRLAIASGVTPEAMNEGLFKDEPSIRGLTPVEVLLRGNIREVLRPEQERIVTWLIARLL